MRSPTNPGEIKLQQMWDFISYQITCWPTPRNWSHKIREMQWRIIWEIFLQNLWRRWKRIPSGRLPWKMGQGKPSQNCPVCFHQRKLIGLEYICVENISQHLCSELQMFQTIPQKCYCITNATQDNSRTKRTNKQALKKRWQCSGSSNAFWKCMMPAYFWKYVYGVIVVYFYYSDMPEDLQILTQNTQTV